jgi:hypothetical protein
MMHHQILKPVENILCGKRSSIARADVMGNLRCTQARFLKTFGVVEDSSSS